MVELQPDAVLVLGDTNSCLSVIGAKRLHIPIFHMESTNIIAIIAGRHLAGKAFHVLPSLLPDLIQTELALCELRLTL